MTQIKIDIKDCSDCPFFKSSPYPTMDSFERPEYWWCCNPDNEKFVPVMPEDEKRKEYYLEDEQARERIIKKTGIPNVRKIAGYVEWHDKTPVPDWCLVRVD